MNAQKGIAPIIIIALIVLASGGVFAVVQRDVLKSYFEKGDTPAQAKRTELKDEFKNGDIPNEPDFVDGKKPTASDFKDTIDSGLNIHDDELVKPIAPTPKEIASPTGGNAGASTAAPVPVPPRESSPLEINKTSVTSGEGTTAPSGWVKIREKGEISTEKLNEYLTLWKMSPSPLLGSSLYQPSYNYGEVGTADHITMDVEPWIKWGGSPQDTATPEQRVESLANTAEGRAALDYLGWEKS